MKLHDLKPQDGSRKDRKRVGRGVAAGQGKTDPDAFGIVAVFLRSAAFGK